MSQAQNSPYARGVSRRSMLRGAAGLAGVSALGVPALAACSSSKSSPTPTSTGGSTAALGTVKIGSNGSDPVPKQAFADLFTAAQAALPGLTPAVNTVDHNT